MRSPQLVRSRLRTYIPTNYSGWLHFWFINVICLTLIVFCIFQLQNVTTLQWLTPPLVFLYANLCEYLGHRGPMHHKIKGLTAIFKRHSLTHHQFFTHENMSADSAQDYYMVLFPKVLLFFFIVGFALPTGYALSLIFSKNVAWLYIMTATIYYLNYEWLHLIYHLPQKSKLTQMRLFQKLKNHHRQHHNPAFMKKNNFNITYPLFDKIMGTTHDSK